MNIIKKIFNPPLLIVIAFAFLFIPISSINASAQCTGNDSSSPAIVTSSETRTQNFGNMSACFMFCPSGGTCASPGICTYSITTNTTYSNCAAYCSAGYVAQNGGYCIPSGAISCGNANNCTTADVGGGLCQDTCQCSTFTVAGNITNISGGCVSSSCSCNQSSPGTYCQFSQSGGTATFPAYMCTMTGGSGSSPSGVDIKATVWTDGSRSVAFAGQLNSNGPVWAFTQAPYRISWGPITNATSCTINGTTSLTASQISSGGSINTFTFPYGGVTTINYILSCTGPGGSTTDNVVVNVPAAPTNIIGSCPAPGTSATFSWTAPSGWPTFYTRATNMTTGVNMGTPAWDDAFVGTSKTFTTLPANTYHWWVYTKENTTGAWSDPLVGTDVICGSSLTPDLKVTIWQNWTGTTFSDPWIGYVNKDGPLEVYSRANYTLYWNAVPGAVSCTLNGTPVSTAGGNMQVSDLNSSVTHTYSCVNTLGATYSDTVVLNLTPPPTNFVATCSAGTVSSSWSLPAGYTETFWRANVGANNYASPSTYSDDFATTNKSFTGTNGQTYTVFIYTKNSTTGSWSAYLAKNVTCSGTPSATISANPTSGTSPVSSTITWSSTNSTGCTATGGTGAWAGAKATSGSQLISGITSNTAFNIYCSNGGVNSSTQTANVSVIPPSFSLLVNKTIGGYVKSSDNFIACGAVCSKTYSSGTTVTLTAYPDSTNWRFVGWTGDCSGSSTSCTLNINSSKSVTAIFTPRPFIYKEF